MKSEYRAKCPKCKEVFAGDDCWTYCPICGVLLQVIKLAVKPLGTAPGKTLDRIDNDGHYTPGNVKWSTPKEQRANQGRHTA